MFTIQRQGFKNVSELRLAIVSDLIANGFKAIYPVDSGQNYVEPTVTDTNIILETTLTSNVLHGTQPWRMAFKIWDSLFVNQQMSMTDPQLLTVHTGTDIQLMDNGTITRTFIGRNPQGGAPMFGEPLGTVGGVWTGQSATQNPNTIPLATDKTEGFVNRYVLGNAETEHQYPMSYRLSITQRGVFVGVWQTLSPDSGDHFQWFVIQRSVNKDTGVIRGTDSATASSKCPVFCVSGVCNDYRKFIVRESDVPGPTTKKTAGADDEDSPAVLNPYQQVSFSEDGNYVLTFLNTLSTPRYRYTDELDMIATISADVVAAGQEIEVSVYGEATPRVYRALQSSGKNGTGMRLLVQVA